MAFSPSPEGWRLLVEREESISEEEWLRALCLAAPEVAIQRSAREASVGPLLLRWQVTSPLRLGSLTLPRLTVTIWGWATSGDQAVALLGRLDARMRRGGG